MQPSMLLKVSLGSNLAPTSKPNVDACSQEGCSRKLN